MLRAVELISDLIPIVQWLVVFDEPLHSFRVISAMVGWF